MSSTAAIGGVRSAPPAPDAAARRLTAVLRARLRRLASILPVQQQRALQLLPALFQARFDWPELRSEPPGVDRVRSTLQWTKRARALELPPPSGIQRGRRLIAAMLVTPRPDGLELHLVPAANLSSWEGQRLAARAQAVERVLHRRQVPITVALTGPAGQPVDAVARGRWLAYGALLAGRLPPEFFTADVAPHDPLSLEPWRTAPDETARALSLLALEPWSGGELAELHEIINFARAWGQPAWRLADSALLAAARAALRSKTPWRAFAACALMTGHPATRRGAWNIACRLRPTLPPTPEAVTFAAALDLARRVAVDVACAVRRVARTGDGLGLRFLLQQEVLAVGCLRAMLPALHERFAAEAKNRPPALVEQWSAHRVSIHLGAAELARGVHAQHAWVRALELVGRVSGRAYTPPQLESRWRHVGAALQQRPTRRTLLLMVEHDDVEAPPHDPLNRGPERRVAARGATLVLVRPRGRPSARPLPPDAIAHHLLREVVGGADWVFLSSPATQPLEARLTRLARRCQVVIARTPLAVEIHGEVVLASRTGLSRRTLKTFAARPVRCAIDPEAPDLGAEANLGRPPQCAPNQIDCQVWASADDTATLLFSDERGWTLRETIPLAFVEQALEDAQHLLRASPASALSIRVTPDVARVALGRVDPGVPPVEVAVFGSLPFGLSLTVGGERFGAGERWGWGAAAAAVLSRWPIGTHGRLVMSTVDIAVDGLQAGGIERLYARSLARRRLESHMRLMRRT